MSRQYGHYAGDSTRSPVHRSGGYCRYGSILQSHATPLLDRTGFSSSSPLMETSVPYVQPSRPLNPRSNYAQARNEGRGERKDTPPERGQYQLSEDRREFPKACRTSDAHLVDIKPAMGSSTQLSTISPALPPNPPPISKMLPLAVLCQLHSGCPLGLDTSHNS